MDWMLTLETLVKPAGVSGSEMKIAAAAKALLASFCNTVEIRQGNVCGSIGTRSNAKPHGLLDAHMDQVGFLVTSITEEGFVRVGNVGGLDFRLMSAQRVTLHGKEEIPGVISCMPPHLQDEKAHVPDVTELMIDTGYSKETLEQMLSPGDAVSFKTPFQVLQNGRVTGAALDDRCGMAAIFYALELLREKTLPCTVDILFSTQEEVGERGAAIGAYRQNPDIALAIDVTFAKGHGDDPTKCGKLGGGPMIGLSPSLSPEVSRDLIAAAKEEEISWQPEVMAGLTGTNADRFSTTRGGVLTGTVSIPLLYMHTPSELIQISDVEETGKLLAAYLMRL